MKNISIMNMIKTVRDRIAEKQQLPNIFAITVTIYDQLNKKVLIASILYLIPDRTLAEVFEEQNFNQPLIRLEYSRDEALGASHFQP